MKKEMTPPDFSDIENQLKFESIERELILVDDISLVPFFEYPVKMEASINMLCLQGEIETGINLKHHTFKAPCFISVTPGQIVQYFHSSSDFSALFAIMSRRFIDSLQMNIQQVLPLGLYFNDNPSVDLTQDELNLLLDYYGIMRKVVSMKHDPSRMEVARHLIQAFFYGVKNIFQEHITAKEGKKSRQEIIFATFTGYVKQYYKEQRSLNFYAEKLYLTPKHLSAVIKNISGKSANEWINRHVILEAQALLKSTNMTIQQISDELNFANQSFFGKYFKQHVGMSPKEYKKK